MAKDIPFQAMAHSPCRRPCTSFAINSVCRPILGTALHAAVVTFPSITILLFARVADMVVTPPFEFIAAVCAGLGQCFRARGGGITDEVTEHSEGQTNNQRHLESLKKGVIEKNA